MTNVKKFATVFFLICLAGILVGLFKIFRPFFAPLAWALILSATFYSPYTWLCQKLQGRRGLSAFLMLIFLLLVLILPVLWVVTMLAQQSVELYEYMRDQVAATSDLKSSVSGSKFFSDMVEWLGRWVDLERVDLQEQMLKGAQYVSSFLAEKSSRILGGLVAFIMDFLIMLITMYYLFKDGDALYKTIKDLSPLPNEYEDQVVRQFRDVSRATLYGNVMTSVAQGAVGSLLFWALGLSAPLLWGAMMAVLSFIPVVGSSLVWAPAGLYLLLTGHSTKAVIMWLGGGLLVGMMDNVLKPMFIQGKSNMHGLLVFFSVFGGVGAFGFLGLLLGPLVVALFLTFLQLYRLEFKDALRQKEPQESAPAMLAE